MRITALCSTAALVATGCIQDLSGPPAVETIPLRATITPDNRCTVETLGRTYTSIGHVRGATPPTFTGTLENSGFHAVGCWVAMSDGTDGDFVLLFSGDSFQKPFEVGSYLPRFEPPYGSSEKLVSVSFQTVALPDHRLKTVDQSTGAVTIEAAPGGGRIIRVDVSVIKYEG
ncbi:MAG TPA: hypothetical protein VES88_08305 [Gemmatimonadaceae bacterium]|nr:hypothetical protein [Gemmatimonadaceae bacterium]